MAQRPENTKKNYKPRPGACGPRPHCRGPRPQTWMSGPDPMRHDQYTAWMRARAQANFREEGWQMTFEEFETLWNENGNWHQRGRGADDLLMTRRDPSKPWSRDNCYIELRKLHLKRYGLLKTGKKRGPYKKERQ